MIEDDASRSEVQIGQRLKDLRQRRRLTLADIGRMSGVSVSALSKIENDQVSPSFDILKKICDGLEIGLEDFVRPGEKNLVSGRKTATRLDDGLHFTSGQYDYKAHATELSRKSMAPLEMRIRARSVAEFDHWSRHGGEEFAYVLSGEIEVHTEHYVPFRLVAGESAYFDSSMKHLFISVGDQDARVLSVSCDPAAGSQRIAPFAQPAATPGNAADRAEGEEAPRRLRSSAGR